MPYQKSYGYFIIFFAVFLFSCKKKDIDKFGPKVVISSPGENQIFNVNDVVQVNASVNDETDIRSVSISLVDAGYSPAHISVSLPVTSPSMTINTQYALDNIHLETGIYYLLVTASDGTNTTYQYQKISVTAVPKAVKKVFVTTSGTGSQTDLFVIDSTFTSITPYRNFSGDYIGSNSSSYFQQVYMCGNYTGSFSGIKLLDNSLKFSIPALASSSPYFTGFFGDDKNNYSARYDGYITGYDYTGNAIYSSLASPGFYAQKMCFNSGYLIAEEKDKTSAGKKLLTYYPSGAAEQEHTLNQDVVSFCDRDYGNVFVFGNVAGQGTLQLFDRIHNNLWNPYPYPLATGAVLSAVKIDPDTYLIGHSNGIIYKYNYQSSSVVSYLTGYTAVELKYDNVTNTVYIAEANRISIIDYSAGTLVKSINSAEPVLGIDLLYNR